MGGKEAKVNRVSISLGWVLIAIDLRREGRRIWGNNIEIHGLGLNIWRDCQEESQNMGDDTANWGISGPRGNRISGIYGGRTDPYLLTIWAYRTQRADKRKQPITQQVSHISFDEYPGYLGIDGAHGDYGDLFLIKVIGFNVDYPWHPWFCHEGGPYVDLELIWSFNSGIRLGFMGCIKALMEWTLQSYSHKIAIHSNANTLIFVSLSVLTMAQAARMVNGGSRVRTNTDREVHESYGAGDEVSPLHVAKNLEGGRASGRGKPRDGQVPVRLR
ncbi:unnamed protein product [Thlaspi arvense]|uniref:Uncharacterized protein n=1 Tax=Thlaspi arvense TaxID=13288 RepID=A0AAU9T8K6_THLAR|nr:unnamed protein product [Thlaspi arvense]